VVVVFEPVQHAAYVNVAPGLAMERMAGADYFLGRPEGELGGQDLGAFYEIPEELRQAVERRFANQAAPRLEVRLEPSTENVLPALALLIDYSPRSRPPRTVRLSLRESAESVDGRQTVVFGEGGGVLRGESDLWEGASEDERKAIEALVIERFAIPLESRVMEVAGGPLRVSFLKEDVRWPFRPIYWSHPMGIDEAGRDVLARVLYAFRISMSFGILLVIFTMVVGTVFGAVQGYLGGIVDISFQRLIEVWSALPFLYVMILLADNLGPSFLLLLIVYGVFNWIGISYYIRGEFLRLRRQQFVEAARAIGVPTWKILFKHILPNALIPLITFFPFSLVGAIGVLAGLDYLGFGMPPPTASWGELLNQAQTHRHAWWLIVYPSMALFVVMLLGVFIGEGVRNAFDPRDYERAKG